MPNVYGMDTSDFPGHAVLGWYWANCGFRYTGFYVAPAPRHPNQSWMSQRDELAAAGWGFLPVYVGLQINASGLSTANGAQHGKDAARLMTNAKFHAQTICYLDLEDGTEPSGNYAGYISAWVTALQGEGYVPGIYCSHRIADWCRRKTPYLWTFRLPSGTAGDTYPPDQIPKGVIANGAIATQYRQDVFARGKTTKIDLDVATVADPSHVPSVTQALGLPGPTLAMRIAKKGIAASKPRGKRRAKKPGRTKSA